MNHSIYCALSVIALATAACGSDNHTDDSSDEGALANASEDVIQKIKLYEDPELRAARDCELYTELEFSFSELGTATLRSKTDGFCGAPIPVDERSYQVRRTLSDRCGGNHYEAVILRNGKVESLKIVDNRKAAGACPQVVARVEVEEARETIVKLASDRAAP